MSATPRQQRAAIKRDLERELRAKDRLALRELRDRIAQLRAARKDALARVRATCSTERDRLRVRQQRERTELRERQRAERDRARSVCSSNRTAARSSAADAIGAAERQLVRERADQRLIRGVDARKRSASSLSARERREESDQEVERNIPSELVPLWRRVKRGIRASGRRSRTEAFVEWVHDHPEAVWELHEATEAAELARLERAERELARGMRTRRRYQRSPAELAASLSEVPF